MARHLLTEDEWACIEDLLPPPAKTGRPRKNFRRVLDGILWIVRTGAPWRDLPAEFGKWKNAWHWFDRLNHDGTLDKIVAQLQSAYASAGEIDSELWCADGTVVRAARCAAGGGKKPIRTSQRTTR